MCVSASDGVGLGGGVLSGLAQEGCLAPTELQQYGQILRDKRSKALSCRARLWHWDTDVLGILGCYTGRWSIRALGWQHELLQCLCSCPTGSKIWKMIFFFSLWFGHNHVDSWSPKYRRSLLTLCRTTYSKIKLINDRVWGCESVVCNVSLFGLSWKASAISSHFTIIKHSRFSSSFSLF